MVWFLLNKDPDNSTSNTDSQTDFHYVHRSHASPFTLDTSQISSQSFTEHGDSQDPAESLCVEARKRKVNTGNIVAAHWFILLDEASLHE